LANTDSHQASYIRQKAEKGEITVSLHARKYGAQKDLAGRGT